MKEKALNVLLKYINNPKEANEALNELIILFDNDTNKYTEKEIDFSYLIGVFNVSGIDGLQDEIQRLKSLGKKPHDIIKSSR